MRITLLILLGFLVVIPKAYAIPIPALLIGGDFILLLIPIVMGFFSIIYFYFRKYIVLINIFLLVLSIILYSFHFFITHELFLLSYEYMAFFLVALVWFLSYKIQGLSFIWFLILPILLVLSIFLMYIDVNLYNFHNIWKCIQKDMYSNINIKKSLYKDNFLVIYWYDTESKRNAYTVIENGLLDSEYYLNKGKYYIVHGWDRWLWKWLSDLAYKCIK